MYSDFNWKYSHLIYKSESIFYIFPIILNIYYSEDFFLIYTLRV